MTEQRKIHGLRDTLNHLARRIGEFNAMMGNTLYVKAEISSLRLDAKKHLYLELVERDESEIVAKTGAHIWRGRSLQILNKFKKETGIELAKGMTVVFCVSFDFSAVFGFSFNITDIDTDYTLGELAKSRRLTIERLEEEGLIEKNKRFEIPVLPLRIAVVSAEGAAGYGDFTKTIRTSGFRFEMTLYQSLMQGNKAPTEIMEALRRIEERREEYDVVVIVRGGGAETDLVAFDDYELCAAIARMTLPVMTGIGHERDISVADIVANTSCKTPTAVGEELVMRVKEEYGELLYIEDELFRAVNELLDDEKQRIKNDSELFAERVKRYLVSEAYRLRDAKKDIAQCFTGYSKEEEHRIELMMLNLKNSVEHIVEKEKSNLKTKEILLTTVSPDEMLKRGYTLTFKEGRVAQLDKLKSGDVITTMFVDGEIESVVK